MNYTKPISTYPRGLSIATGRNRRFREALGREEIIVAPGAFDCITARLVEKAGFPAVYVTGSGVSLSALGAPDVGVMSYGEIYDRVRRIADSVSIPVIADCDTGYGGPLNVIRAVRELERAGVTALQIEDQAWPKKCGHEPGRKLASVEEMVGRIKAATDARLDQDVVIIARTDARSDSGMDAALDRANRYAEAGADLIFLESPESEEELARLAREVKAPVLANMVEGGRTPITPASRLQELGFNLAIYPNAVTRTITYACQEMLENLKAHGTTNASKEKMLTHRELWDLFDNENWIATEKRFQS